jgi:hypothetical protein
LFDKYRQPLRGDRGQRASLEESEQRGAVGAQARSMECLLVVESRIGVGGRGRAQGRQQ